MKKQIIKDPITGSIIEKKETNIIGFECVKIDSIEDFLLDLINDKGYDTIRIINEYDISEDIILEYSYLFNSSALILVMNFSENFVNDAIEKSYFSLFDIKDLSMATYSNLSTDFLEKYKEYINWSRMLLYICTQTDSFDDYETIIDSNNLWQMISSNDLDINFIRKWKDKLDWDLLSITKYFTDDEKLEFINYIVTYTENDVTEKNYLWKMISSNNLDIETIRHWKDKLDWDLLLDNRKFTDSEKLEFSEYIF